MKFFSQLFLLFSLVTFNVVNAQDFEVAPVTINFSAEPGEIQSRKLNIKNHNNKNETYRIIMGDFDTDKNGQQQRSPAGTSKNSCAAWLSVSPGIVELAPNEEGTIEVIITVPAGHNETRWGMIYVESTQEQTASGAEKNVATGVILKPRIAIQVTQSPRSNKNYSAKVSNIKEVTQEGDEFRSFTAVVINNGGKVIEGQVGLFLANLSTAKEEKFKGVKVRLIPGASKTVKLTLPKTLDSGKYVIAASLDYGHKNLEMVQMLLEQ